MSKSQYTQISLKKIKTISIKNRKSKVEIENFAKPFVSEKKSFNQFVENFPNILVAKDLKILVERIVESRKKKNPVIFMMGAHMIKVGLSPIIIDLIEKNIITSIAMNSASAIHDIETAFFGKTSEDVAENILDGTFGMSKETGDFLNNSLKKNFKTNFGYGESLAKELILKKAKYLNYSIIAKCFGKKIPITIHAAIGTDINHQQPTMNGAVIGEMSFRDFKIFTNEVKKLCDGGVVLNFGSAVIMPEIFLKSLTIARNLKYKANGFTTANFDMNFHYRPQQNIVQRPTQNGGKGFYFIGHHEIMFPLLSAMIKSKIDEFDSIQR